MVSSSSLFLKRRGSVLEVLLLFFVLVVELSTAFLSVEKIPTRSKSCHYYDSNNNDQKKEKFMVDTKKQSSDDIEPLGTTDRRSFVVQQGGSVLGGVLLAFTTGLTGNPNTAAARDELFKPNPLTNPLLERIRILEQAEADDIKYEGELTAGDAGNKGRVDQYPKLLVPILIMEDELRTIDSLIHDSDRWQEANKIIQQSKYDKIAFKKVFNAFADNIYYGYGDSDRANAYLGGGATPKTEQSLAYLLRNEILTNIEALQAELEYLLKDDSDKNETEDLYKYSSQANAAMDDYLKNVSPTEIKQAKEILAEESS